MGLILTFLKHNSNLQRLAVVAGMKPILLYLPVYIIWPVCLCSLIPHYFPPIPSQLFISHIPFVMQLAKIPPLLGACLHLTSSLRFTFLHRIPSVEILSATSEHLSTYCSPSATHHSEF